MTGAFSPRDTIKSLYDSYSQDIYRYAYATLGDPSVAYDVVQEVFIRAYKSLDAYRGEASHRTWLMTIARNYMFDHFRKKHTERQHVYSGELPELADGTPSMDIVMEVRDALSQLNPDYRNVIVLRHMENLSVSDTASVLGWSERKVRNATHRALERLRQLLDDNSREVKISK